MESVGRRLGAALRHDESVRRTQRPTHFRTNVKGRRVMRFGILFLGGLLIGCSQPAADSQAQAQLTGDAFAAVGLQVLPLNFLSAPAPAERTEQAQAIVHDALLSQKARRDELSALPAIERGTLGRALVESLEREALRGRPPTQAELNAHRKRNWLFLDRPRAVRSYEAVINVETPMHDSAALVLAEQVRSIALETHYLGDFAARLNELAKEHPNLSHGEVPPIAYDSRVVPTLPQDTRFRTAPDFYGPALAKLEAAGDVSELVGSQSGYHVFIAAEIIPALHPPDEQVMLELSKGVAGIRYAPELERIKQEGKKGVVYPQRDIAPILRLVWRRQ